MYFWIYKVAFYLHISLGVVGLISFWLPMLSKKGSLLHKQSGVWFVRAMYIVSVSGMIMCFLLFIDPIGIRAPNQEISEERALQIISSVQFQSSFLLMLSLLTFSSVHMGVQVLKAKSDRKILRTKANHLLLSALLVMAIVIGMIGWQDQQWLLLFFAIISGFVSVNTFHYMYKEKIKHNEWIIAHLGGLIGAGIAAYTAFFAFGGRQFLSDILSGQWQMLPWVLPSIIGVSASQYLERKYVKIFKVG